MSLGVICKTTKGNAEANKMSVGFTKKKKKIEFLLRVPTRSDTIPFIFAIMISLKSRCISLVAKSSNVWCASELLPFLGKKVCKLKLRPEEKPSQLLWVWTNRISATENIPFLLRLTFFLLFGPTKTRHTQWLETAAARKHTIVLLIVWFPLRREKELTQEKHLGSLRPAALCDWLMFKRNKIR